MRLTPPITEPVTTRPALLALLPADVAGRMPIDLLDSAPTCGALRILATIRDPRVLVFVTLVGIDWGGMLEAVRKPGVVSHSVSQRVEVAASLDGWRDAQPDLGLASHATDLSNWGVVLDALSIARCGLEEPALPREPMRSTDPDTPRTWRVSAVPLDGPVSESGLTATDADLEQLARQDPDHCTLTYHGEPQDLPMQPKRRHLGALVVDGADGDSFRLYDRLDAEDGSCGLCRQERENFVAQFGGGR